MPEVELTKICDTCEIEKPLSEFYADKMGYLYVAESCKECVDVDDWHLDHVKPLSKGGEHTYANVAHPKCNLSKGAKFLETSNTASEAK
jgi:5-methylcytosine-specific restriction endonuclease McrA